MSRRTSTPGTPRTRPPADRAPRRDRTALARLFGLGLGLVALVSGCEPVGKGNDPDPVADLARPADLGPTTLCSAKTCNGCCEGNVCQPGVTAQLCGTRGNACVTCSGADTCSATFQCAYDPNGTWLVATVSATLATTNSSGMPWRSDGSMPQPLVQFDTANRTNPSAIAVTGTAPNQVWTVTWAMGFTYPAKTLLATGIDLQVLDKLTATTTSPMSNKHRVNFSPQDFSTPSLTYQNWEGVKSITLVLQKQ